MPLELFMRFLTFVFSKVGGAFIVGFFMASFLTHNSINYADFIAALNNYFVRLILAILGL